MLQSGTSRRCTEGSAIEGFIRASRPDGINSLHCDHGHLGNAALTDLTASRLQDTERATRKSATLSQVLQVFRVLLDADGTAAVGDADAVIWKYLRLMHGLGPQVEALEVLQREMSALNIASAFGTPLLDTLDRHRRRLNRRAIWRARE